jgi:hypothetical protein
MVPLAQWQSKRCGRDGLIVGSAVSPVYWRWMRRRFTRVFLVGDDLSYCALTVAEIFSGAVFQSRRPRQHIRQAPSCAKPCRLDSRLQFCGVVL